MLRPLLTWLISLRDSVVAEQRAEIKAWEERGAAYYDELQKLKQSLSDVRGVRTRLLKLIDAILKGIDFPVESVSEEWKDTPATAQAAVGSHVDARLSALQVRASKAEKDAEDLRAALEQERTNHAKTSAKLEVSDEQNEHLWDLLQRDRSRVAAEAAIHNRRRAQAENDARRRSDDEDDAPSPVG